jgi:CBS domain containing-hemolysin-like protein
MALRTFSWVKLQEAFKADGREHLTDKFVEDAEKLILSCSLYRLIANIGLVISLFVLYSAITRRPVYIEGYIVIIVAAMAIFSVFSLAIPHAWAKYGGEKLLVKTYKILMVFAYPTLPILSFFKLYDRLVRRLAGVTKSNSQDEQDEKEEEFLSVVEQHKMEGVVDEEEQQMIENVLEFSETTAEEIMTPRTDIIAVDANTKLPDLLEIIGDAGHSRIPVYEENIDSIIGLVYAKDLLTEIGKDPAEFKLCDKIRDAYFVPETKPLRSLLHEFQNQKQHIAIVLDEYGGTAGIVTIEDILEELVGEIVDEYEELPPKSIKRIDEKTVEVDARIYMDDFNEEFGVELPEDEDYDTLGGFVFSHLGYIPKTGETFDYDNLKFVISSAEPRRIKRIRVEKAEAGEESSPP